MINVAMVEDSSEDTKRFQKVFGQFCSEKNIPFTLSIFERGSNFLSNYHGQYDIVFMDIELPDANGLEISKRLREKDSTVILIFLTNMAQYAINGYEVEALDFIVKPIELGVFTVKMKRILRMVQNKRKANSTVVINGGKRIIASQSIRYVEVNKHDITYHTTEGEYMERTSLKEVQKKLQSPYFSRPNYCYIVNLQHIAGIDKYELTLDNGEVLLISRHRKREFAEDFSKYLGGTL